MGRLNRSAVKYLSKSIYNAQQSKPRLPCIDRLARLDRFRGLEVILNVFFCILSGFVCCYGRPLSVSGRPCYILPMFIYLFIYLFMAALFSSLGERRFAKVLHVVDLECH